MERGNEHARRLTQRLDQLRALALDGLDDQCGTLGGEVGIQQHGEFPFTALGAPDQRGILIGLGASATVAAIAPDRHAATDGDIGCIEQHIFAADPTEPCVVGRGEGILHAILLVVGQIRRRAVVVARVRRRGASRDAGSRTRPTRGARAARGSCVEYMPAACYPATQAMVRSPWSRIAATHDNGARQAEREVRVPQVVTNGARLFYDEHGTGPETIVFAHGLLWSGRMFDAQVAALRDRYRCVTFDFRGQGQSAVTRTGYDMETLTEDAAALIRALDCAPCHFAGLSMGGFVAMRLGARHPELLRSLVLLETSADPEPAANVPNYRRMARVARVLGTGIVASRVMPIMFGRTFLGDPARATERPSGGGG